MENTIGYRGYQFQISLDIDNEYIVGEIVPNENFKDLKFRAVSDSFSGLIEKFENYIDTFLEEREETFTYKNVALKINKTAGGKWKGNSDYFIIFEEETLDKIKQQFMEEVNVLEESAKVWNELQEKIKN